MKPRLSHADATLPAWLIAPVLAGLVAFSGTIVFAGWLVTKPMSYRAPKHGPLAKAQEPPAEIKRPLTSDVATISTAGPSPVEDDPIETTLTKAIQLQRGFSSQADESPPPPTSGERNPADPSKPDPSLAKESRSQVPIQWLIESVSATTSRKGLDAMNLMMPVEVAKIETGPLHYSMRRLRFPDGAPQPLRLAVTPFVYDDLASLLTKMGDGYRFLNIKNEDTYSFDKLKNYDVLFLTCSEIYAQDFQSTGPLRRFVEMGGTLYASDLRGDLLYGAFPEFRARNAILPGIPQNIHANVIDQGLQSYLGRKTIPLSFDAPDWRPAGFDASKATVCLNGIYRNNLGQTWTVPLMVKFRVKRGTVIFTSFHNSKNDSEIVKKLLEYMVFAAVNARSEARVKELMQRSQFAAHDLRTALVSANKPTIATYQHKGGGLQIAVGFENLGAKLKLTLHSPKGQTIEHEDQGLYLIEFPNAEPGPWRYTITPIELPFPNFPFVVAIGTTKS